MKRILVNDPTLRDGNHAVHHQIDRKQLEAYCKAADLARIPIVEVGHGNGLGASSLQLGQSLLSDEAMVTTARANLNESKLGVFVIAGFGTVNRELKPAIERGVDVVRVGSHCTEADTTARHLAFAREQGKDAYGCLMMSHMAEKERLAEEVDKMASYGAMGVVLMDSAGAFLPDRVSEVVSYLVDHCKVDIGFHAHQNLGMAIANSLAAVQAGARIVDGTARGFGAGAGNAALEQLIGVLHKMGYETGTDLYRVLDLSDIAEKQILDVIPVVRPLSIVSGMAGVVSTFSKHVERISKQYDVDGRDVFFALGKRKVVAGQEDMIIEVAMDIAKQKNARLAAP